MYKASGGVAPRLAEEGPLWKVRPVAILPPLVVGPTIKLVVSNVLIPNLTHVHVEVDHWPPNPNPKPNPNPCRGGSLASVTAECIPSGGPAGGGPAGGGPGIGGNGIHGDAGSKCRYKSVGLRCRFDV